MKIAITLLEGLKRIREAEKRMWIKQDSLNAAKIIDLEIKSLNKAIKILNVHHSEAPKVGKHKESGKLSCVNCSYFNDVNPLPPCNYCRNHDKFKL